MSNLILTAAQMQALEQRAFAEGVDQEGLMDVAGIGIAHDDQRASEQQDEEQQSAQRPRCDFQCATHQYACPSPM